MARTSKGTPTDRGYAWVVLASCFVIRMLVDGFWSSLGIFFVKWQESFSVSVSQTAGIGSMFMLILLTSAPISSALSHRLSHRVVNVGAGIIVTVCCFAVSHVTEFWHIYILVPPLSFGLGMNYQTCYSFFFYYFEKRFALAGMLVNAAGGVGFFSIPPLMEILISNYGWKGALQITSAIMANLCVCGVLLRPPKLETSQTKDSELKVKPNNNNNNNNNNTLSSTSYCWKNATTKGDCCNFLKEVASDFDLSLFRNLRFIFQAAFSGLLWGGICTAIIYLVPYSSSVGISDLKSSSIMFIFGICCVIARLCPLGWLIDKKIISASTLSGIAHLICGISITVLPFTKSYLALRLTSVVFGLSAGVGGSALTVLVAYSAGPKEKAQGAMAWHLLLYGVGATICILLTGFLHDYTGNYQPSLIVCGIFALCLGVINLSDPCLIRLQTRLDDRRKRRNVCSQSVHYTSLANGIKPAEV